MKQLLYNLPEVVSPTEKKLGFSTKLKWTLTILLIFFVLGAIPLIGLDDTSLRSFEQLSIILGAEFGSLISLGIGPIVTASIVLQLLNGAGIVKFDTSTHEGKRTFSGVQKLLAVFFVVFESFIYVYMGGFTPVVGGSKLFLVFQLFVGGMLIMGMDEVISKWGFGSGLSLFIAAGVSKSLVVRTFSWLPVPNNPNTYAGAIPEIIRSVAANQPLAAGIAISAILATFLVFAVCVFGQAMKVEIPLSFGRVRGHGIRWPLSFMYTSNIPVILVAALLANIQLWASLMENWAAGGTGVIAFISNHVIGNSTGGGLLQWVTPPNLVQAIITSSLSAHQIGEAIIYTIIMIGGSVMFSIFWVQTSGQDPRSMAKQIMNSGLQLPGFRKDERVLERVLARYIGPLTVMGGILVGFLAALADVSGALTSGTGLLLAVMIIYRLYEEIAKQHMMDMNPMMRKFME